ncbi:uncharacterized protein N7529_003540 [Penicillium soppii]|jgi:hypothetical protein|uniref:uncharacterized protein n=1 Tax=Penicillium soppii TaxID=69789 RepID=UPI002548CC95|nr:uncharacterized protein N7529_003540 [Penicillium soppii]KAJ5871187.1 hypothetical protein N7529_003540 [Penicillium soppii]
MAEELTSVTNSLGELWVADRNIELSGSDPNRANSNQIALVASIQALIQFAKAMVTNAHRLESSAASTPNGGGWEVAQLSSLRTGATALARITKTFNDAVERYIVAFVTSFARPGTLVQTLLSHFDCELMSIARDVLNCTNDDSNVLRKFLEMCYDQALHTSGTIHPDRYFVSLGEASLGWPFDSDYESEQYYEHENRLDSDPGYAENFRRRCRMESERKFENRKRQEEEWIGFWVQALRECPNGPTL